MSKKTRKNKKKVVSLPATTYPKYVPTFCGFRLIKANHNQLWTWDTLESVAL